MGDLPMSTHPSAFDHRISRRDLLRGVTIGSGLALLAAATPLNSAAAAPLASVAAAQPAGGKEFHGAWPYELPPTGHFNYMVGITHAILRGGIYDDMITLPMAMYYWKEQRWLPLLASTWSFDPGASTFNVTLDGGMQWSDGKPITSKDVVSTFWAARILRNVVWEYVDNVPAVDDLNVSFHMFNP